MEQQIAGVAREVGGIIMWAAGIAFAAVSGGVKYVHGLAHRADKKADKALVVSAINKDSVDHITDRLDKIYDHLVQSNDK